MDMSKYKAMFVSESREQLTQMGAAASQLQRTPENRELIDQLFRQAHSIKGMAASMEYSEITDLAHSLEDLMSGFRDGSREPDKKVMDLLLEGIDALSGQVDARAEDQPAPSATELVAKVRALLSGDAPVPASAKPQGEKPATPAPSAAVSASAAAAGAGTGAGLLVKYSMSVTGTMAGLKGFLAFKRLSTLGNATPVNTTLDALKKGEFAGPIEVKLEGAVTVEQVGKLLGAISEVASWEAKALARPAPPPEAKPAPEKGAPGKQDTGSKVESTVRVRTSFLDYFINAIGELTALRVRLAELAQQRQDPDITEVSDKLERHVRDLYAQVMSVRLMPLESVTSILPRTVRELARKNGKEISFEMHGQELEVDRSILEVVLDPLIHLLRNCVDHGIETPTERESAGKPREGAINLSAYRERERTVLQVTDDGRGIDPNRLRNKAVSKGLLTAEAAERLSDKEAVQLICLPGLSTAETVTETSGRGVGMDAVKAVMERIGGELIIDSVVGKGTIFLLSLPRSVAIVPVLLVAAGTETFAFPLGRIVRTVTLESWEIKSSRGRRFFMVDEDTIPLVSLSAVLNVPRNGHHPARTPEGEEIIHVVLVEKDGFMLGVEVDSFAGHQEAFIKPLPQPLGRIGCLGGAMLLGSGKPVFVIEVGALFPGRIRRSEAVGARP